VSERNIRLKFSVDSELSKPAEELERLIKLEQQLIEAVKQASLSARADSSQQVAAITAVSDALEKQRVAHKKAGDEGAASTKQLNEGLNALNSGVKTFTGMIAAAFTIVAVKEFGDSIIQAKTQVDSIKLSLDTMIGSKKESTELYAQIVELAKKTPFTLQEVSEQAVKLKAYNIETADLIPTITALGNIAAAVGKDKLPQLTLAYGQIRNAGVLMGTELRQLNETGLPILDLIAKSYSKTAEEVKNMSDDHVISFAMVRKAIMDASAEGGKYAGLMEKLSKTVGGEVSNLKDIVEAAYGRIGDFFEVQISSATRFSKSLIQSFTGTDSAIQRTVDLVSTLASGFLTYQVVTNAVAIKEGALAAAMVVKNAAISAGNLIIGTYDLLMITAVGSTDAFSAAQVRSAAAAKSTWAVFASNPIGAFLTVLGVAVTAYTAFRTVTDEVTTAVGEQQFALQKEQKNLNIAAESVMQLKEGTEKRKEAMQDLINKYPEYFQGLSAEATNNATLRQILEQVNGSYKSRIALAKEAYRTELVEEQFKKVVELEQKVMKIADERLPKELMIQVGGDPSRLLTALQKSQENMDTFAGNGKQQFMQVFDGLGMGMEDALKKVVNGNANYEREVSASDARVKALKTQSTQELLAIEDNRHKKVITQLKEANDGTAKDIAEFNQKMAIEEAQNQKNILGIKGEAQKVELTTLQGHEEKTKNVTLLSAKELSALLKTQNQETLNDKLKALDAQEKAEIESVNKVTVSRKVGNAELARLQQEAADKILAIQADYNQKRSTLLEEDRQAFSKSLDVDISTMQANLDEIIVKNGEYVGKRVKSFKEIADEDEKMEKRIQEANQKTAELVKESVRIQKESKAAGIEFLVSFLTQQEGLLGGVGQSFLAVFQNIDLLSGKSQQAANDAVSHAKTNFDLVKAAFDNGIRGTEETVVSAYNKLVDAQNRAAMTKSETLQAVMGVYGQLYQVLNQVAAAINDAFSQTAIAIGEAIKRTREAYNEFFEFVKTQSKEAYQADMENFVGSVDEKIAKINEFYEFQKEIAQGQAIIDATLAQQQAVADIQAKGGQSAREVIEALTRFHADQLAQRQQDIINQSELEKQQAADVRDAKIKAINDAFDAFKATNEAEQTRIRESSDEQKQILQDKLQAVKDSFREQVDAARESYNTQLAALKEKESQEQAAIRETFALKQQLLEQAASDEIEAITIIDRLRNEAVERYGISEADKLIKTRDRILATLTDEKERADVTAFYEGKLKDLHDTVESAKLDKSLGVSIATKQLNQELKDDTVKLKGDEKTALEKLGDDYNTKFNDLADERDKTITKLNDDRIKSEDKLNAEIRKLETETKEKIEDLQDQLLAKESQTAQDKKKANFDYKVAVMQANSDIFEATKAMKIAELEAEKAILRAKRNFLNAGKINAAIDQIDGAINAISGLSIAFQPNLNEFLDANDLNSSGNPRKPITLNGRGVLDFPVFDANGNPIQISYVDSQEIHIVYDKDKNEVPIMQATGRDKDGKVLFNKGTEFVDDATRPDGVDTVPAMLTKGERVIPTVLNKLLGGAKLSNDKLVENALGYQKLIDSFPQLTVNSSFAQMKLPDHIMNGSSNSLDVSGLRSDLKSVERAIRTQKHLAIKIDKNGFATALVSQHAKINYNQNLMTR
jgi:tape measure domain-containing protein